MHALYNTQAHNLTSSVKKQRISIRECTCLTTQFYRRRSESCEQLRLDYLLAIQLRREECIQVTIPVTKYDNIDKEKNVMDVY